MAVLDELILQCLIIDGRAPYRRIADVVGSSEQTVARRIRDMQGAGLARVVVRPSNFSPARRAWTVRMQCRPDAGAQLADALARRDDVGWVSLVSGGSEVSCTTAGPVGAETDGVLAHIPRASAVLSFTAQALLRPFAVSADEWTMFDERLTDDQADSLRRPPRSDPDGAAVTEDDAPLLAALDRDGRAGAAALARETGWPASRVSARMAALFASGALYVGTDFLPEAFGYHAGAIMYLTVPPGQMLEVGQTVAAHRETGFVAATTGPANLYAVVTCRTSDRLFHYVSEQVGALPGVQHLDLAPFLRRFKQFGTRVAGGRLVIG